MDAGATNRDYGIIKTAASPFCRLRSVDLKSVQWTEGFWADRFKQCYEVTLPHHWRLLSDPEQGHVLTNLRLAAGLEEGEFAGVNWQDEWIYKWMEAAACIYAATDDKELDRQMDEVISVIAQAQQPDGYISTQITLRDLKRFQNFHQPILSHFCSDWHMPPEEMPISCGFTKINLFFARSYKPAWNKRLQKTAKV